MKLIIDNREPEEIINIIKSRVNNVELKNLELGDFHIVDDNELETLETLIIIERKSISDLIASIKDGRYNEQSFRLNENLLDNSNIYYLVEGDSNKFVKYKKEQEVKMLYSSMLSLSYYKKFSLIKCNNIIDSCEFIIRFYEKLEKDREKLKKNKIKLEKKKVIDYINNNLENQEKSDNPENVNPENVNPENVNPENVNPENLNLNPNKQYINVIKNSKKSNITIDNIDIIMLSQIPNISSVTASELIKEYKSLKNLIDCLEKNENILDNLKIKNNNSTRKLNKTTITNLKKYLLHINT